ncbi:hypothetical protein X566_19065 [Afipia sp. P52-10]|uniref:hypothetical protein n=1 Tax=Afipia sp. P52-10 TaxID=1429916 RepID=UPI0003DF3622|nr:hypothetical protein [Afipia sp. P52-10]ETR75868.1 hypothetical protein X566_19065 [Afipia sp. P52-10]
MTDLSAAEVFRDFNVQSLPASGPHKPVKREVVALLTGMDDRIAAGFAASGLGYVSRAALFANLVPVANSLAQVRGDGTAAYNGYYKKKSVPVESGRGCVLLTSQEITL